MAFKAVLLCLVALLVQTISGKSCGCSSGSSQYASSKSSISSGSVSISSSGGDLLVTSLGPISPSGITVSSELDLSGELDISGELPFLSAVEFQTKLDTSGSACVDYSCGSCNNVGINSIISGSGKSK